MATSTIKLNSKYKLLEIKTGTVTLNANSDRSQYVGYNKTYTEAYPIVQQSSDGGTWEYATTSITRTTNSNCILNFHNLTGNSTTIGFTVFVFGRE